MCTFCIHKNHKFHKLFQNMNGKSYESGNVASILDAYFRDISVYDLLTKEEEREISAKSFGNCEDARNIMILSNLRLVVYVAKEYARKFDVPLGDLINEGNIALMDAVEKYNPNHEPYARFSTYAVRGIRQHIKRVIENQNRVVRIPVGRIEKISKIDRANHTLSFELGRDPSTNEISERTGLGIVSVTRTLKCGYSWIVSIHSPISDNNPFTYADNLSSDTERVDVGISRAEDLAQLSEALTVLTPKELIIIKRRFGLNEVPVETLDQIGLSLGLTRERIRQIESKALGKLRRKIAELERGGL